jgi:vancomycin resistance protein YoaR
MATKKAGNYKSVFIVVLCLLIIGTGAAVYSMFSKDLERSAKEVKTKEPEYAEESEPPDATGIGQDSFITDAEAKTVIPVYNTIAKGVSIENIDVGGLTRAQAESLLAQKESEILENVAVTFRAGGKQWGYTAADLGISLNAGASVEAAFKVKDAGTNLNLGAQYQIDEDAALARLNADTDKINIAAVNASAKFDPKAKEIFSYLPESDGISLQTDALVSAICTQVALGKFSAFEAPVMTVPAALKIADIKANTVPVVYSYNTKSKAWEPGFTSYFKKSSESGKNRVYNIVKLAGILNGTVIKPGETFSLNKKAGPRTVAKGWKIAHGIVDGRYEDQPGGGVCQVSGTLYNAALRAELAIVERYHHSWPSTYLPKGLDATISTGGPDLKIKNNFDMPVYILATADAKAKSLKIIIYGKPPSHGLYVDFTSKKTGTIAKPKEKIIVSKTDLEGNHIPPGQSVTYAGRDGQKWVVYKQWKDANGKVVQTEEFNRDTYAAFAQRTVINSIEQE